MSRLYDDVVLDHIRNARNYRVMEGEHLTGEAVNALCGDTFTVHVRMADDVIDAVSFQCECCGISMASASIMTEWVRGRRVADALAVKAAFLAAARARAASVGADAPPDHAAVLRVVAMTPNREGCATLAWSALENALATRTEAPAV
jgi:nitrogen fixation NifU-like protein